MSELSDADYLRKNFCEAVAYLQDNVTDGMPTVLKVTHCYALLDRLETLERENARLTAALQLIIDTESKDMDGNLMPESDAAFIARKALEKP